MTFKQIIDVLWQRKWLIVAVMAVAMLVAGGYLALQVKSYTSDVTARTSATVSNAASSGELGGVQVDFDPSTITSPKVLNKVATLTHSTYAEIAAAIQYDSNPNADAKVIDITAVAPTPTGAQARVNAVLNVYTEYLRSQISTALKTLEARQVTATQTAVLYEQQVNADPNNSIAAASLANALGTLGTINNDIQSINNSGSPITILTAATPGTPNGPTLLVVLALALAAGLIAGIGVALTRDQFDNRLRGEYEIESLTGLPALGELSYDKSLRRSGQVLPAGSRTQTPLSEGLRSVRTSIQVLLPPQNAVIAITSVNPGDGKTFVSANIALAWARTGKKVILVGGDLRRPGHAVYFGGSADGQGLSDILREASTPDAAHIVDQIETDLNITEFAGLRLLPSGSDVDNPADLLATAPLREIIEALRRRADIVIIDTPPALALVDAQLLAEHTDGIVVLASVNRTDRSALVATTDMLKQNGITTLGVVANRSRRGAPKSYAPYYLQAATPTRAPVTVESADPGPGKRVTRPKSAAE